MACWRAHLYQLLVHSQCLAFFEYGMLGFLALRLGRLHDLDDRLVDLVIAYPYTSGNNGTSDWRNFVLRLHSTTISIEHLPGSENLPGMSW